MRLPEPNPSFLRHTFLGSALLALAPVGCDRPAQPSPDANKQPPAKQTTPEVVPSSGHDGPAPTTDPATPTPKTEPTAMPEKTEPKLPIAAEARGPSQASVAASNDFGFRLYGELAATPGNLAYSPASMSLALAMTYAGARGETAAQMQKVLSFPADADSLHRGWASVVHAWNQPNDKLDLAAVNRLFAEKTYTFEQPFLQLVRNHYAAPVELVDFRGAAAAQREHINTWVERQTRTRIKDLLPPPAINADTRLVLVNALYFKAKWANPFRPEATKPGAFFADGTREVQVPLMTGTEYHRFAAVDGIKLLEMRYEGSDFAMVIALPDARDGLAAVEQKLAATQFDSWLTKLEPRRVRVTLPKFKIDPANSLDLTQPLKKMGMPLAFERFKADFTAMANPPNPEDRLNISQVFHKAFVAVDEHGTEAAAATAVVMARAGGMPAEPEVFAADHPFLFFIRDTKTGLIAFVGRVNDPSPSDP